MSPHRVRRMSHNYNDIPVGVLAVQSLARRCCPQVRCNKETIFKASIFGLTYLAYTCYHMSRKPISVVKSVLHTNCSTDVTHNTTSNDCGYAPFDDSNAPAKFALLDSSFLFCYAAAMFVSGFVAERVSLRYFLAFGMIFSGVFSYLFGIAKTWSIHNMAYFVIVQACAGIAQTTGWPGVVTLVGRWFGKTKRGLPYIDWQHLGHFIAAQYVESDWALSFIVPGIIIAGSGFLLFLFLVDCPEMVGCYPQHTINSNERLEANDSDLEDSDGVVNSTNVYDAEVNYRPSERTPF
ncbi:hypothetical protein DOY81_010077 [Sarcophaga bullata]|nr:hypothetical protein DOY81_010077 [Sarcophaga bullata]